MTAASTPSRWRMAATRSRMLGMHAPLEVERKLTVEGGEVKRGHRVEFARVGVYPRDRPSVSRFHSDMLPTRLPRVVVVALATLAVACGDPTRPRATSPNLALSFTVNALTGTSSVLPNAIGFFSGPRRADAAFDFDVALDLDATGKIVVYPV